MVTYEILKKAIDTYGTEMQLVVACEELSELQKEICKSLRGRDNLPAIAEEIADVEIMLEQLKIIFNCSCDVGIVRQEKLERLARRIERDEK